MRQSICITFPRPLSSTIIVTKEQSALITPRVLTNIRINGKNRKFVGSFQNLQRVLKEYAGSILPRSGSAAFSTQNASDSEWSAGR